jgi:hypothetical protein
MHFYIDSLVLLLVIVPVAPLVVAQILPFAFYASAQGR